MISSFGNLIWSGEERNGKKGMLVSMEKIPTSHKKIGGKRVLIMKIFVLGFFLKKNRIFKKL